MDDFSQAFYETLTGWGIALAPDQLGQLLRYQRLLLEWNQQLNLTAIREPKLVQTRHFLDSLSCALVTGDLNGRSLIDVGTGAGFPGLPLKILYPHLRLTLVESVGKKCAFLQTVVEQLALTNVAITTKRAEEVAQQPQHREQYDWAAARAVADLPVLLEYLLPLCAVGGNVLAQKGQAAPAELEAARQAIAVLGGGHPLMHQVQLPGLEYPHFLVVVPKVVGTPARYPRRPGIPGKRPL